jgi:hypothetical protein
MERETREEFLRAKKEIDDAPVLSLPEGDKSYALYTDASKEG